ncbi:MAG TPA: hypothetical protein VG273_13885 [Bryobacteraceae bacterium]|jgi:hypothetical protein|nr:hypothetical protein [Bryobacteraceae bacterium]
MASGKTYQVLAEESGEMSAPPEDEQAAPGPGIVAKRAGGPLASIFARAVKDANTALPVLDKLRVLSGDSRPRDVNSLKVVIRSEFTELVGELALANGPRTERVEQIFSLLLDQLAALQDGIEDEENLTNFRILADCVASLYRSWNNVQQMFSTQTGIVLQQFKLLSDAVEDVRFTMDAAAIGPVERKGLVVSFGSRADDPQPFSVDELLEWVHDFATSDGPAVLAESGGFGLRSFILPAAKKLGAMATAATDPQNLAHFAKRYNTPPLQRAMKNLEARLDELAWNC